MVTLFAWIAHKLVSSNKPVKYASDASCNAKTACDWNRKSVLKSWAISLTKRWNGNLRIKSSVDFWYFLSKLVRVKEERWAIDGRKERIGPPRHAPPRAFFRRWYIFIDATRIHAKALHSHVKKHFHARQRSHARDRSPSTPRVKEKTNLLISKTPPKLTENWRFKIGQKNRDPSLPNLSQRYGARPISVRLLDTTSRWRRFARGLRRELFSRGFPAGGFTSGLFGTSHLYSLLDFLCRRRVVNAIKRTISLGKGMDDGKDEGRKKNNWLQMCQKRDVWFEENTQKKKREIRRRKHTRQTFFYNTTVHINELPNYTL